MSDESYIQSWRRWKEENPGHYTKAAILPVTGQVAAVLDWADAMDRGDSTDGAIAAASFIPGVGLAKSASKLAPAALRLKSQMNPIERAIAPVTNRTRAVALGADAEQVGEVVGKTINSAREKQAREQEARDREYQAAWSATS